MLPLTLCSPASFSPSQCTFPLLCPQAPGLEAPPSAKKTAARLWILYLVTTGRYSWSSSGSTWGSSRPGYAPAGSDSPQHNLTSRALLDGTYRYLANRFARRHRTPPQPPTTCCPPSPSRLLRPETRRACVSATALLARGSVASTTLLIVEPWTLLFFFFDTSSLL